MAWATEGEARDSPTLDQCVASCGNIVRTDQHAAQLPERADILGRRPPTRPNHPLRSTADEREPTPLLRSHHDHTRITRQETPA
ncbi:hypothetical protein ACWGRL_01395 [[Kitasatospora] papulosa]|uniref:hypothetical protein n=1 Tax=Streptomyces sp. NPDC004981 TaxID=3156655 RepID=UPI0033AFB1C5